MAATFSRSLKARKLTAETGLVSSCNYLLEEADVACMTSVRLDHRRTCVLSAWEGNQDTCRWCDQQLTDKRRRTWCSDACRRVWERNHVWRRARAYARKRAKYVCSTCGANRSAGLEVNHMNPVNGSGYGDGCSHHQDNLETLCHACHVKVTNDQRASGLIRTRNSINKP